MPGVFPDYPAPVVRNVGTQRELVLMRAPWKRKRCSVRCLNDALRIVARGLDKEDKAAA